MHIPQIVIPDPVIFFWGMIFMGLICYILYLIKVPGER